MPSNLIPPPAEAAPLVILSSARRNSDTQRLVRQLLTAQKYELINLLDYDIALYSYEGRYEAEDRFLSIVMRMLQHEQVVFATPVYWYSMSGLLKNFFDRLTDLVTIEKALGRQMAGKKIHLFAVGSDEELPMGFEEPFRLTAAYFDMHYTGCYYCPTSRLRVSPS